MKQDVLGFGLRKEKMIKEKDEGPPRRVNCRMKDEGAEAFGGSGFGMEVHGVSGWVGMAGALASNRRTYVRRSLGMRHEPLRRGGVA